MDQMDFKSEDSLIVGIVPKDEKWRKYQDIYNSCVEVGIEPPVEVQEFFNGQDPNEIKGGREVEILHAVERYESEHEKGYAINLSEIPEAVTVIRVYTEW